MNIIEELQFHEKDQLNQWLDYSSKKEKKFMKALVQFSKENPEEIKTYCRSITPKDFSSLSIVYEALSEYANGWNDFFYEEVERLVTLAKDHKIPPSSLDILTDIETEDIYDKDEDVYIKMLDFMTSNLQLNNNPRFTIALLDVVDWFLIELDEDDEIPASKNWIDQITKMANEGDVGVKKKARKVLNEIGVTTTLTPLSFVEKLKGLFK